jgi:hypothetical protein
MPSLIKDEAIGELFSAKYKQFYKYRIVLTDFKKYLTNESIDLFNSLRVFPNILILFGHVNNSLASNLNPIIHTDIMKQGNAFVKVPFAINYELTDTPSTMSWFDTNSTVECYPDDPLADNIDAEYLYGSGINYGSSKNRDASGYKCLDSCQLNAQHPILFRNNIPHCVSYPAGFKSRISASIRFPLTEIATFEEASGIFS